MGTRLIQELQQEHGQLLSQLQQVRNVGVETAEGVTLLGQVKTALLQHLSKEDELLYPVFREKAQGEAVLEGLLLMMADEMSEITEFVLGFFDQLENKPGSPEIAGLFLQVGSQLLKRIRLEEVTLYPEYERLIESSS